MCRDHDRKSPWATPCLAALCLLTVACGERAAPPNVLLVTLDTTRADRLGCYGYAAAETPSLDTLAERGVRFERAHAQVPLTLPSHASMLTGTYARVNGVQINGGRLGDDIPTLAEGLKARGYRTAAFVSSFVLDSAFGLDRGFDVYDDEMSSGEENVRFQAERSADRVVDAALPWLDEASADPFFAWVHFFDPHSPYAPPVEYAERFSNPYDGELAFVDAQLQRLLEWLDTQGLRERTVVIVVGDHGEAFGEHDEVEHGLFVYDSTIRVPLILSWPSRLASGRVVEAEVGLIDLYPTILELAGASGERSAEGRSLVSALSGPDGGIADRLVYGETRYGQIGYGWAPLRFVLEGRWKFVEAPLPELYDRTSDAGELDNLVRSRPQQAQALRARLLELEQRLEPRPSEAADLDAEAMERLRSLGYVGGVSGTVDADADLETLRDPKQMVDVFREHYLASGMLRRAEFAEAATLLEGLLERSPESIDIYEDLGWAYLSLGRNPEAQRAYEASLANLPEDPERLWGLAESLRRQNRFDEAVQAYQRALAGRPKLGEAHMGLTLIYAARGQLELAERHARRHLEINPDSPIAKINLANVSLALGNFDEAIDTANELLETHPSSRAAHMTRWQALHDAGRGDDAIEALRSSHEALAQDWSITCALAWMLAVTPGQDASAAEEALGLAVRASRMNPSHPRSFDTLAAAHAANGSYDEAVRAAQRALQLAGSAQYATLRGGIEARLTLYRTDQPYVE